jgi:hypothetical protein
MAATVEIDETNGAPAGTLSHGIANTNYGTTDAVTLDPVAFPITPGGNSFQKWQQWHVTAMGGSVSVRNLKYFATAPATNSSHLFNGHITQGTYDTTKKTAYEQPDQLAGETPNAVPTSAPASANIGIGGSLTGALTAVGSSDFVVSIITTTGAAVAGTTLTVTYRYDEVA